MAPYVQNISIYLYIYLNVLWECVRLISGALCVGFRVSEHRKDALIVQCGGVRNQSNTEKQQVKKKKGAKKKEKNKKMRPRWVARTCHRTPGHL